MGHLGRRARSLSAITAAAVAVACAASDRTAVIGLAYRSLGDDAALLAAQTLDSMSSNNPLHIRLVTDHPPDARQPTGQLANEVGYATRMATVENLIAVVGHQGSRDALMVAPIYNEAGVPVVIPTGTSRRLRDAGPWSFMLAPDDSVEGAYIGELTERLGAANALLFYVGDEYGVGLRDGISVSLAARGIRLLDAIPVDPSGSCAPVTRGNEYATIVDAALRQHRPAIVLLAARQREAGCIIRQIHGRYPSMRYIGGDGILVNADFLARAGPGADSLRVVGFWHPDRPDSLSRDFARRFRALTGREARSGDAMVYDAIMVQAHAIRVVGPSRERVRDYLASLGSGRRSYTGVTGPITFPAGRDKLVTLRVRGTRLELEQ